MAHPLERLDREDAFTASDAPMLAVDDAWVIRAVNPAYLAVVGRQRLDLLGVGMFEAFPDNPDDPRADGVANLGASFETVLRTNDAHRMALQRYDVRPAPDGEFVRRFWTTVNSPLRDTHGRPIGALHHVEDVTSVVGPMLDGGHPADGLDDAAWNRIVCLLVSEVLAHERHRVEVGQLRQALASRVVIEQAKGVVMALRRVDADEAFETIRRWARSARLPLHAVAAEVASTMELPPPMVRGRGVRDA